MKISFPLRALLLGALFLLGVPGLFAKDKAPLLFLPPAALHAESILPPPPATGSEAEKADLDGLHEAQAEADPAEIARATKDAHDSVWDFAEILGPGFTPAALPKTSALFTETDAELKEAIKAAKDHFQRPRPAAAAGAAESDKDKEKDKTDYAYPSGHASRAYAWATLLADLHPDRAQPLLDKAGRMGWNRIVLGKHFPADVAAGKAFGAYLAHELLQNPAFQARWKEARDEAEAATAVK